MELPQFAAAGPACRAGSRRMRSPDDNVIAERSVWSKGAHLTLAIHPSSSYPSWQLAGPIQDNVKQGRRRLSKAEHSQTSRRSRDRIKPRCRTTNAATLNITLREHFDTVKQQRQTTDSTSLLQGHNGVPATHTTRLSSCRIQLEWVSHHSGQSAGRLANIFERGNDGRYSIFIQHLASTHLAYGNCPAKGYRTSSKNPVTTRPNTGTLHLVTLAPSRTTCQLTGCLQCRQHRNLADFAAIGQRPACNHINVDSSHSSRCRRR